MPPIDYSFTNMFNQEMAVTPRPNGRIQFKVAGTSFLLEKAQASSLAAAVLPGKARLYRPTLGADKPETVTVGEGTTEARVFVPTSDAGAERNINFAKANLVASQMWTSREPERKAKAKREAEEKAAKTAAAQKSADELAVAFSRFATGLMNTQRGRALTAYNARYGTTFTTWEQVFSPYSVDTKVVGDWIGVVEALDRPTKR